MTFINEIGLLIDKSLKTYTDDHDRFIADYNREQELTREYNGRQLLELLQNADDAASIEVEIIWDKTGSRLIISNKGDVFSSGGIRSLMIANLSTKTKISYIGNKGLGFRAILNWAEDIRIFANGSVISFSETIARDVFEHRLNLSANDIKKIRKERNLSPTAIPFPVLGIPGIEILRESSVWTTSIEINCKQGFEDNIEQQLDELTEEVLLFLNHIRRITIRKHNTTSQILRCKKEEDQSFDKITIADKVWRVFRRSALLPEAYQDKEKAEEQHYELKVALRDDLSDDYQRLFNFFPTQLSIALPCIIHGTFELNSSRNHLNDSERNRFILLELVTLLRDCAMFLAEQRVDWRPYRLISSGQAKSDSKLINEFYGNLETLKKTETIYPVITGTYHALDAAVYYSDGFSSFFQANFPLVLPDLLLPLAGQVKNSFKDDIYLHNFVVEQVDTLSRGILSQELRAELIAQLAAVIPFKENEQRFSLLVNDRNEVIDQDEIAFTPVLRSGEKFHIPKKVKLDFVSLTLFDLLAARFESTFDKKEPRSRELQRIVKAVVNMQPYDSNNVIDKIITGTKEALKTLSQQEEQETCVQEMVAALFANFRHIDNRQEKLKVGVPLTSDAKKISDAETLFLSASYVSGQLTAEIYRGLLKKRDYLAAIDYWGLENQEPSLVEAFFLWLGVNKYARIASGINYSRWGDNAYFQFIFQNGTQVPDDFDRTNTISRECTYAKILNFEQVSRLSPSRLLLLVLKDELIRHKVESNNERIDWFFTRWRPTILPEFSYIRFQFANAGLFTSFTLEDGGDELNRLINDNFVINYELLFRYGVTRAEARTVLLKLGAKESLSDVAPENIYNIVRAIPGKDKAKKGRATQLLYKLALDGLVAQESAIRVPKDILYFARRGEEEDYVSIDQIFYADNAILPKRILNTLYILNLPKRSGEDHVAQYFGIRSLRDFNIQIHTDKLQWHTANEEFSKLLDRIKPYLLAYRLNSPNLRKRLTETTGKQNEARTLRQFRLELVRFCFFSFATTGETEIEPKEFINGQDVFYYRQVETAGVESLKKDSIFCDAFAEMMCIIFKVNDLKNDFRQILKNDIADTHHLALQDLGKQKIDEAYRLLGMPRHEIGFWQHIFQLRGYRLAEPVESASALKEQTLTVLGIDLPEFYGRADLEGFANKEAFELLVLLCREFALPLSAVLPAGLYFWHKARMSDAIRDDEYLFRQLLWAKLNLPGSVQSDFIKLLNFYNNQLLAVIEPAIQKLRLELFAPYQRLLRKLTTKHCHIDLNQSTGEPQDIRNLYEPLLSDHHVQEADIVDERIRSLLFFPGNTDDIRSYLLAHFEQPETERRGEQDGEYVGKGKMVEGSVIKGNVVILTGQSATGGPSWIHSGRKDAGKKNSGRKAEVLVYQTLVERYGKDRVRWVSGYSTTPEKDDRLHYDMQYKNDADDWKFLEVKALSENHFIISSAEVTMGLGYPESYEFALVDGETIYMIKDIFLFTDQESFDNNPRFRAEPKDYVFSVQVGAAAPVIDGLQLGTSLASVAV